MTGVRLYSVAPFALALLVAPVAIAASRADFIDLRDPSPVNGNVEAGKARATTCMGCHGAEGIAPVPLFPNLAGQHAEYLHGELLQIQHEANPDAPMTAQVADLDDEALRDLSVWFASLPVAMAPAKAPSNDNVEAGRLLYRNGDPARGIPPCQGCHGAKGEGHALAATTPRWRIVPILRGQHAPYLAQRLRDFRDGKHTNSSSARVMTPIAATLDDADIEAIAQWIGSGGP